MAHASTQLCTIATLSDPLTLALESGSYFSLPLGSIFTPEGQPVSHTALQTHSIIQLVCSPTSTYGILQPANKGADPCSSVVPYASAFIAFLELIVLKEDPRACDYLLQWQLGQQTQYYVQTLKASFNTETLNWACSMIRSNGEAAIAQELESIVDNYKRTTQLVSDLHWGGKQVSSQTWQLHALASIFNVIIDYTSVTNRKIWRKRYYPNTASILCPVLALYGDAWLQGRASFSHRKEYSLAENLLPGVKEMYETRMQSIKRVNISEMMSFRPIAEKLERRFEACGKDIEANREKVDEIVLSLYDLAVSQVSIIGLIDVRTKCAFMNCGKMANHYFQCNHGVCQECVIIRQQQNTLYCGQCRSENQPVAGLFPPLTPQEQAGTPPPPMFSTCSRCKVALSPAKWPIPEELHQNVYQLDCCDTLCSRCLEKCVREGYDVCPTCQYSVDMHEKEVLKTTVQCDGCCLWKPLIRDFPAVNCQDHRLCIQCVSQLKHITTCRTCNR